MKIGQILSLAHHCLHLCNNSNIEDVVFSYAIDSDVFVTNDTAFWEKRFKEHNINCRIKMPRMVKPKERIVVDGSSLENGNNGHQLWEEKWKKQPQSVCVYNIDKLEPNILKSLVKAHDKMILSADRVRMISDKNLEEEIDELSPEIVESLVKQELKNILLSFLLSKPMSGTDLVKLLYQKFKVFISPGMLYPTLHELEKKGLLKYECNLRNKIYSVEKRGEAEVLLRNRAKANSLVCQFLLVK